MALADIIKAIQAQRDKDISALQERVLEEKNSFKRKTDDELKVYEDDLKKQTKARKTQLTKKAHTMVQMEHRKTLLEEKRKAIDSVYDAVIDELKKLSPEKMKKLEEALEKKAAKHKGEKKPSKEGGFTLISEKAEEDFTFPHLVQTILRPETELEVSSKLFQ